jgi:hypothetical protein
MDNKKLTDKQEIVCYGVQLLYKTIMLMCSIGAPVFLTGDFHLPYLLSLFFNPKNGGNKFFRNVGELTSHCTVWFCIELYAVILALRYIK